MCYHCSNNVGANSSASVNRKCAIFKCNKIKVPTTSKLIGYFCLAHINQQMKMANFIAPLPSAFNHEAKDPSFKFRYWSQCFTDFCEINNITDAQTLIKLFRSDVGRPTVTYLEDLPN